MITTHPDGTRSAFGGQAWKVTPHGVELAGKVLRTAGQPMSARRYLDAWEGDIREACTHSGVPVELLLATICAENGPAVMRMGEPWIRPPREEPGYISDEATPHRISVGPCHLLLSTAGMTRAELSDLPTNLKAACRYIRAGWGQTGDDPVLVSARYNSGGLYRATGRFRNAWNLRSWVHVDPDGNRRDHITGFVSWYGDALAVLRERSGRMDPAEHQPTTVLPRPTVQGRPIPKARRID